MKNAITCCKNALRLAVAAGLALGAFPSMGAAGEGTSSGQILTISPDPVLSAAGGSQSALPSCSPAAALSNPASLTGVYRPWLSLSYRALPAGISESYAGFALPTSFGYLGGSIMYAGYGDIPGYDNNLNPVSIPGSSDTALVLSYALPIVRQIPVRREYGALGLNLKFLRSTLAWYSTESIAVDLGARANLPFVKGLTAGLVYQNLGSAQKFVKEYGSLPTALVAGLGYTNEGMRDLSLSADYRKPSLGRDSFNVGVGFSPVYFLSLRAGWQQAEDALSSGISTGLGLRFGDFSLDYTMVPLTYFGAEHHLGFGIALGGIDRLRTASDYYLDRHFRTACEYYYQKNYIAARQSLEEILSVYPDHAPSQNYLRKIAAALEEEAQERDETIARFTASAERMLAKKDLISATRYYRSILAVDPENPGAKIGLDRVAQLAEEVKQDKVIEQNREKVERIWKKGLRYYRAGDLVQSKTQFQDVLAIDPENAEAKNYVVEIDNQLSKIAAEKVNELFARGVRLFKEAEYYEAMRYFEAVLLAAPQRLDAEDFVKKCREGIDDAEAKERADKLARNQAGMRNEMTSVYDRALRDYEKGRYESSYQEFLKAEDIATRYVFTEYQENIKTYLATLRGTLAEDHYKKGFENFRRNNREAAAAEYKKSLEYYPDYPSALVELERLGAEMAQIYYERGMAFYTKNDIDKAREMFKKSLSYRPDKLESQRALERIK